MIGRLLAAALVLCGATCAFAAGGPSAELESLVAAERAFARTSVDEGMRTAFLTWLGEGSVVFRPRPVDARPFFEKQPEAPGTLMWEPVYAEISSAGDMGSTTGPYEFRPHDKSQPSSFGHYVSVWGRRPDGSWRVLVDHGTPHPQEVTADRLDFPPHNRASAVRRNVRADTAMTTETLLAADRAFAEAADRHGVRRAYQSIATSDVRLCRAGSLPVVGHDAVSTVFGRRDASRSWAPERAGASVLGTLGYTIGSVTPGGGSYVRIWRKEDGKWKLVVDILPDAPAGQ